MLSNTNLVTPSYDVKKKLRLHTNSLPSYPLCILFSEWLESILLHLALNAIIFVTLYKP